MKMNGKKKLFETTLISCSNLKAVHKAYYEKKEFITICKPYILQTYKRKLLSFILAAKVGYSFKLLFSFMLLMFKYVFLVSETNCVRQKVYREAIGYFVWFDFDRKCFEWSK